MCAKCPQDSINILRLCLIFLAALCALIYIVKTTLRGAKETNNVTSIYIKILLNHTQLILLTASFNFYWPKELLVFATYAFWYIYKAINKIQKSINSKAVSSITIALFFVHPTIVQKLLEKFKCMDIDGESRLMVDLEIICYNY